MGDPETEAVFPRIKSDIIELFQATIDHKLLTIDLEIDERAATTIILASGGYPEDFEKGKVISGIDEVNGSFVFHCGTTLDTNGNLVTNGGRVLAVTSLHKNWKEAIHLSNENAAKINFEGKYFRKDIGFDL